MRAPLILIAFLVALPGCLEGGTTPPAATPTPGTTIDGAQDCREGEGAVFLAHISGGGFVPQDFVPQLIEVTHDGHLRSLRGHSRAGDGNIVEEKPGALGNLTVETAREMLRRANITLEGRDLVVTRGLEAPLAGEEYVAFCDAIAREFPTLKERYVEGSEMCADQGSTTWQLSMRQGDKRVFVDDCARDADAVRPLIGQLRELEAALAGDAE